MNPLDRPWIAPASLVIVIGSLFVEFLFGRSAFLPIRSSSELLMQWYPYLNYWTATLKAGEAPLWSHNLMAGFPLGAFPHAGTFYPLHLVFLAMDFSNAFTLLIFIEAECQVLMIYGLLREWGCSRYASWLGAAAFGLAGFSLSSTGFLPVHNMLTWMPGLFWFGLRLSRRKRVADFLVLTLVSCLCYQTGELETLMYSGMMLLVLLLAVERAGAARTGLVAGALAASLLICAGPFLLSADYVAHSFRSAESFNPVVISWGRVFTFMSMFSPADPGSRMASSSYAGFLLFFGFCAGLGQAEGRRLRRATLGIIAFSLLYIINPWPLSYLFNSLPILRYEASDMRFRILYPVFLLVLLGAGESFDRLRQGIEPGRLRGLLVFTGFFIAVQFIWLALSYAQPHRVWWIAASRAALVVVLAVLGIKAWRQIRKVRLFTVRPGAMIVILVLDLFTLSWLGIPREDPAVLTAVPKVFNRESGLVPQRAQLLSLLGISDLEMWLQFRLDSGPGWLCGYIRNRLTRQEPILGRIIGFGDFSWEAIRSDTQAMLDYLAIKEVAAHRCPVILSERVPLLLPVLKSTYQEKEVYKGPRPEQNAAGVVMAAGSEWALTMDLMPGDGLEMEVRPESAASRVEVQLGQGADKALLSWADAQPLAQEPERKKLLLPVAEPGDALLQIRVPEAAGKNVTLIGSEITNRLRPYHEESRLQGTIIYRNIQALDLYGLYTAVDAVPDSQALDYLFAPERFDPERRLMLAPGDVDPRVPAQAARSRQAGDVKVQEYLNNRVALETDLDRPCYLSMAETYYPGWRAWVDGVEEKIVHADYAFQAVALETAGPHRIELRFIPAEFRVGLWVSLVSAAMFLLVAGLTASHQRRAGGGAG